MTPHHDDPEAVTADRAARRRMLLDHLMQDPDDQEARDQLTALVADARRPPDRAKAGAIAMIALCCGALAVACLLADMDVTATLLAVAGLYAVWLFRRAYPSGNR